MSNPSPSEPAAAGRLLSLDAFRGFTIVSMLMVNNPGYDEAFPDQFRHAHWGQPITFCDLIFPWFLFIVGVALPFSAASFRRRNPGLWAYVAKCFRRALLLVFFGVMIDCSVNKRIVIGMNVLQLIGLAFFAAALLYELPRRARPWIIGGMLAGYWALIRFAPIPGVGAGFFEEDRNVIQAINRALAPWRLAGTPSVIPAAALVLIGTYFGERFRDAALTARARIRLLLLAGAALMIAGALWSLDLPMNKAVWTPSYILFTAGTGCVMLAGFYYLADARGLRGWCFPFVVYGMNAITAYFFSILVRVHTVQEWYTVTAAGEKITLWRAILNFWTDSTAAVASRVFGAGEAAAQLAGRHFGSWLFTFSYITFWGLVLYWMYRKQWFLRV